MTAHLHTEHVEGCYRCELSKDEMTAPEPPSLRDVVMGAVSACSTPFDRDATNKQIEAALVGLADAVLAALREHPDALAAELLEQVGWSGSTSRYPTTGCPSYWCPSDRLRGPR